MPGPAKKPEELRKLDGYPDKKPPGKKPVQAKGAPTPPEWLNEYALKIWDDVTRSMPPGFYAAADVVALAGYCQASAMIKDAAENINKNGITIEKANGQTKNPACTVLSESLAKITTLGTRLGLDPAARQSIGITAGDAETPDDEGFDDLIPSNDRTKAA